MIGETILHSIKTKVFVNLPTMCKLPQGQPVIKPETRLQNN